MGFGREANPVMAWALNISPWFFLFIKLIIVPSILWGIRKNTKSITLFLMGWSFLLYLVIDCIHVINLFRFFLSI